MQTNSSFRWLDLLWFVLVVALAVGARFWYLSECVEGAAADMPPFLAQAPAPELPPPETKYLGKDQPTTLDQLIHNIRDDYWFAGRAPLSPAIEDTAHIAPGYPWAVGMLYRLVDEDQAVPLIRWVQCGLGALTAGLYFAFARMAFGHLLVALLTGLFCALHPFWIVNTAQIQDGVLTSVLLAGCLVFGTHAGKNGDYFCSFLFGLTLAGLVLVRAALLPFALIGLLGFVWRCRELPRGWFFALLAVLGFANVTPWLVRNYQTFDEFIPVANSAWLHVWMGNNPHATGTELDAGEMAEALGPQRLEQLQQEPLQHNRYRMLAGDVIEFVQENPEQVLRTRIWTALYFFLGAAWFEEPSPGETDRAAAAVPDWLRDNWSILINSLLLGMLLLGLLGWRWTHAWRRNSGLATLAMIWIPLPYLLSHAETLWGPRLPLDGILLCYAAFALVCLIPGLRGRLPKGPTTPGPRGL